jgi:hypothetical protein
MNDDTNESTGETMTELDEALQAAREDATQANYFYDAFLNAFLFMPAEMENKPEGTWQAVGPKDRFKPLFMASDDARVVPVFDQIDKLKNWAAPKSLDFLNLKTHVLLQLMGGDTLIVLNPGTEFAYAFKPELLDKLRGAMKPINPN